MKKFIIAIFFLIPLVKACDKYEISDIQQHSFLKYYGGAEQEDLGIKVLNTSDGYLIMGNIEQRGKDICIIRTDKYGNSTKPIAIYGGANEDIGYAIKPNQKGYIIVGSTRKTAYGYKDIYMVQINTEGDTLWTRTYDGLTYDDEALDVLVLENQHIVLTGYSDGPGAKKSDFMFLETDSAGDMVTFNIKGRDEKEVANSIIEANTGGYMLSGYKYVASDGDYWKTACVIRWDGTGPAIVATPYSELGVTSEAKAIVAASGSDYYVACTAQPSITGSSLIYLLKIENNGNIIWKKSFGERTMNVAGDLLLNDNSLILVGTSVDQIETIDLQDVKGDILLLKTDLNGENPIYNYIGDGLSYQGNSLDMASDGGYILTGSNFINTNSVISLCKLDASGTLE